MDRREGRTLSNEEIDAIAERAAELALEKVYADIGKSVVRRFLWIVGAAAVAIAAWAHGAGYINLVPPK
jgi:hypothetical protein